LPARVCDRAFTEDFSGQNTKMSVDRLDRRMIYNWEGRLSCFDLAADPESDKLARLADRPRERRVPEEARALPSSSSRR
jgi:hypothetical protein